MWETLLLEADEVAALHGVSVRHVRRLNHSGKMPKLIKLGCLVKWSRGDI
jgi:predicted DNA-binding transcriptional regulator AlpA